MKGLKSPIPKFRAKQRAADFRAGVDAAYAAIAPQISRRFFLRGMAAGAGVSVVVIGIALWSLYVFEFVVLNF